MDTTFVRTKYKEIVENGGIIPKNLTWIILIPMKSPNKYIVSDKVDNTLPKNI